MNTVCQRRKMIWETKRSLVIFRQGKVQIVLCDTGANRVTLNHYWTMQRHLERKREILQKRKRGLLFSGISISEVGFINFERNDAGMFERMPSTSGIQAFQALNGVTDTMERVCSTVKNCFWTHKFIVL